MRSNDLVMFLRRYGKATSYQVARHLQIRPDTAEAILHLLKDEDKICRVGDYWLSVSKEAFDASYNDTPKAKLKRSSSRL